jgi:MFS transporter, SP family, solute carrier family 2 (myo-inositol transporter), member 13
MTSLNEKHDSSTQQHPLGKAFNATNDLNDIVHDIDTGEINELVVVAEGEERTTWFVWILVLCSTISGLLFGTYSSLLSQLSHL